MRYSKSMEEKRSYISSRIDKNIRKASIDSLPREILTEILARTSTSSFTTLFNAKRSCKFLNEVADDDYIFQKISVEKSPLIYWHQSTNEVASNFFWERCKKSGNREALYMQGVVDYFGLRRQEDSGLKFLNEAAKLGHVGALYTLGVIQLFSEDEELRKKGIQIIGAIKKSNMKLRECRKKLEFIARRIWLSKFHSQRPIYCMMREKHGRRFGWESDDEDDIQCDACLSEREAASFCSLFPSA